MIKLKISSKLLLYFLIVSITPLFVVAFVLVSSGKNLLLSSAITRQQIVANDTASNVDNYLQTKIDALTQQSEIYSAGEQDQASVDKDLTVLVRQDRDVEQVAIVNSSGQDLLSFNQQGAQKSLTSLAGTDAFKAVSYLNGRNFIGSVSYNPKNQPQITIAVPLMNTPNDKSPNPNFIGAVIATYNISDLWQSVLSTKIGQGGYAYVVDSLGNLVAHPNQKFLANHTNIANVQAVNQYINNNYSTNQTKSEIGLEVISTPRKLNLTNWAVIVEEPVSSIYAGIYSFIKLSTIICILAAIGAVAISLVLRTQILEPIRKLTYGVKKFESGDFQYHVEVNTNDELQELANTFNHMGFSIRKLIADLRNKNLNLNIEQTKLNNIISSVSDGIIALDSKGEIISINPPAAKLIGKNSGDFHNKRMADLFSWTSAGKKFVPELKKPGLYHYPDILLQHGNDIFYLDLMVSIIDSAESDVTAIITIHDQTQSRELEFMKLDFVAIAAHELRTPLTVVQGYLSLLNDEAVKQLTLSNLENLQKAIVGTDELRNLINKLLNISRIERGEMEITITKLDLRKLISEVVKQHQTAAAHREQRVVLKCNTDKPIYVPGDEAALTEVANNLIGNALKFTDNGGTVKVNFIAEDEEVRIEVVDTGPGVPQALHSRLFTKFYRAQRSLVAGNRGTGLGLYISKTIIDMHQGKIGIEPDKGTGSTFYFTLPIFNEQKHAMLLSKDREMGGIRGWFKKRISS